jgi:hypothetical protein
MKTAGKASIPDEGCLSKLALGAKRLEMFARTLEFAGLPIRRLAQSRRRIEDVVAILGFFPLPEQ